MVRKVRMSMTRLEAIQEGIERCEYIMEGLCFHCKDKADLISIACAWAFDEGAKWAKMEFECKHPTYDDSACECCQRRFYHAQGLSLPEHWSK